MKTTADAPGASTGPLPPGTDAKPGDAATRVLCVDLDGTLIATDLLWDSVLTLLRDRPLEMWRLPLWLARGRGHLKRQLAARVPLDAAALPYRDELLSFLRREREAGRTLVLATAADEMHAQAVARHLGLFSEVIASDGSENCSGPRKCRALEERFGRRQFDYAGNSFVDLPLWRSAGSAILVAAPRRLEPKVRAMVPIEAVFSPGEERLPALVAALRVRQWIKNVLIFVPVLLDHRILDLPVLLRSTVAFLAFSLVASAGYVLNDLLDIEADRRHPTKRLRPFAAGTLPPAVGVAMLPLLLGTAAALSLGALPGLFSLLLGLYLVITVVYSFHLKKIPVLDVIVLAGLYTLRVLGGIAATGVRFSAWLLAFSMFFFLSLAFMKRYTELIQGGRGVRELVARRGYMGEDRHWLGSVGACSGYMSVLVLALYITSDEVRVLYGHPEVLWLICPLLLYWICRMWLRAYRGELHEDPVVAAVRDRSSYVVGAMIGATMLLAAL